jgi:hypothetical protein
MNREQSVLSFVNMFRMWQYTNNRARRCLLSYKNKKSTAYPLFYEFCSTFLFYVVKTLDKIKS